MRAAIVFDNSSSLGVRATDKDIQILANDVSCAFGCHTPKDHLLYWNMNIADWGRNAGAILRIDVVKQSVLTFLRTSRADAANYPLDGRHIGPRSPAANWRREKRRAPT